MPFAFFLLLLLPLGLTAQNAGNEYVCYEDNGSPYASDVSCAQYTCYDEFGAPFTSSLSCEYAEKANACSCNHCHQQVTCYESCSNPQCPSNMCPCNLCLVEYTCGTVHECAPPENEEDEEDGVSIPKGGGGGSSSGIPKSIISASNILANRNISPATVHTSKVVDNATAKQNLIDVSKGKKASTSNYGNAPGTTTVLNQKLLDGVEQLSKKFSFSISEIAGGSHSVGSQHYYGNAIDVNYVNGEHVDKLSMTDEEIINFRNAAYNAGATKVYDPLNEPSHHNNHFHIQW